MPDRAALIALIRQRGLHALPKASKDALDIQADHFSRALRDYASASATALTQGNLRLSDEAYRRYRCAAVLYAPGIIEALATALLETEAGGA